MSESEFSGNRPPVGYRQIYLIRDSLSIDSLKEQLEVEVLLQLNHQRLFVPSNRNDVARFDFPFYLIPLILEKELDRFVEIGFG